MLLLCVKFLVLDFSYKIIHRLLSLLSFLLPYEFNTLMIYNFVDKTFTVFFCLR